MWLRLFYFYLFICVFLSIFRPAIVQARELSLSQFLHTVWSKSPQLKAEYLKANEREQVLSSARAKFFPHISLQATDTTGFAAANRDLPVTGVMGSPFRSGGAVGIVVEQMVYDFGRIQSLMAQARAETVAAEAKLQEEKLRFLAHVGRLYLGCAQTFSAQRQNERLMTWARLNLQETVRMTKTGQRSLVDKSLVQMEVSGLHLQQEALKQQLASLNQQMQIYGKTNLSCRPLSKIWDERLSSELKVEEPMILLRRSQIELALASSRAAATSQLPFLKATGSFGEMEKARLVPEQNYTAGLALIFPVWNGGEDAHREQAYKSQAAFHQEALNSAQMDFEARIKNLRDSYDRGKTTLALVEENLDQARKTMRLASQRYHQLSGPLIDVREAFKQLRGLESERQYLLLALAQQGLELNLIK